MQKKNVENIKSEMAVEWIKTIPFMVCAADIEEGAERLSELRKALAPVQQALAVAHDQVLMVRICDLVEGAQGLESVCVSVEMEFDDEGGSYPSVRVSCNYGNNEETDQEGKTIAYEMQDWLCDVSQDIEGQPVTDCHAVPADFLRKLSQNLLGDMKGPAWLAARESAALSTVARNGNSGTKSRMSL